MPQMEPMLQVTDLDEVRFLTGDDRRKRPVVLVDPDTHYATARDKNDREPHRGFDGTHIPAGMRWDPSRGWAQDPGQADRLAPEADEAPADAAASEAPAARTTKVKGRKPR